MMGSYVKKHSFKKSIVVLIALCSFLLCSCQPSPHSYEYFIKMEGDDQFPIIISEGR